MSDFVARASVCTRCALSETRQHVVVGSGPMTAPVALVGEAPGRREDESGEPFVGSSGQLLFTLVAEELHLTRAQCYVTSVVKCRPPGNRTPTRTELTACRPWWDEQWATMGAHVIVTLGNTATRAVLGTTEGITALHGQATDVGGRTVVPTFHPAAALRGRPDVTETMRADLRVVAALLATAS